MLKRKPPDPKRAGYTLLAVVCLTGGVAFAVLIIRGVGFSWDALALPVFLITMGVWSWVARPP